MTKKAQIVTTDFIISFVIYLVIVIALILLWNNYDTRFKINRDREELAFTAVKITDILVEQPGVPTNWNKSNVQVLGLVSTDRKLDSNKALTLKNMAYNDTKKLLHLESYEFRMRIVDLNSALVGINTQFIEIGDPPNPKEDVIITIRRIMIYGSQKVILEFSLWK